MIIPAMGTPSKANSPAAPVSGLGGALFTPVQQRVLGLLFGQPDRRFQSAEPIRLAASGTGAAHRLVTRLAKVGLVTVERIGNQKHYQANRASPVFAEFHGLIVKTSGLVAPRSLSHGWSMGATDPLLSDDSPNCSPDSRHSQDHRNSAVVRHEVGA
jgi:hypothetical protein